MLITKNIKRIAAGALLLTLVCNQPNTYAANSFWGNLKGAGKLGLGMIGTIGAPAACIEFLYKGHDIVANLFGTNYNSPIDAIAPCLLIPTAVVANLLALKYSLKGIKQGWQELTTDDAA